MIALETDDFDYIGHIALPAGKNSVIIKNFELGNFKLSLGEDQYGHYISYYDRWNLGFIALEGEEGFFGKPFEIYDRIYYDPVTFEPITPGQPQGAIAVPMEISLTPEMINTGTTALSPTAIAEHTTTLPSGEIQLDEPTTETLVQQTGLTKEDLAQAVEDLTPEDDTCKPGTIVCRVDSGSAEGHEGAVEHALETIVTEHHSPNLVAAARSDGIAAGIAEEQRTERLERVLGEIRGINPVTKQESRSNLYAGVTRGNLDEIFQTPMEQKFGKSIMGAKAVVYRSYDGAYHAAFLTEAINTHHRHAAATLARLVESSKSYAPADLERKVTALYDGDSDRAAELLSQVSGFELQYDTEEGKIIRIKQDSWLTKEQLRTGRRLRPEIEEDMILELLQSIEPELLSDEIRELREGALEHLYAIP